MTNFVTIYLNFAHSLIIEGENLDGISQLESFQNFRIQNLINFGEARLVDEELFGYSGGYWTSAYNYPQEGENIYRVNQNGERTYIGKAINVGLLTFDVVD